MNKSRSVGSKNSENEKPSSPIIKWAPEIYMRNKKYSLIRLQSDHLPSSIWHRCASLPLLLPTTLTWNRNLISILVALFFFVLLLLFLFHRVSTFDAFAQLDINTLILWTLALFSSTFREKKCEWFVRVYRMLADTERASGRAREWERERQRQRAIFGHQFSCSCVYVKIQRAQIGT